MSKYEEKIFQILRKEKIRFVREKTFSSLREGRLRYDFFVPDYYGKKIIIEVNGEQHYSIVKHFHKTRQEFLHYQENDRRKISWALSNGYIYYCIPFWKISQIFSIDDIINECNRAHDRWKNDTDWFEFSQNQNLK